MTNYSGLSGSSNAQTPGQQVTTPSGGPWNNLIFNFYDATVGDPYASGDLYLLTTSYLGVPSALSTDTPGFLAKATASSNLWVFDSLISLNPGTTYYFYMSTHPPQNTVAFVSGSGAFGSANGTGNFTSRPFAQQYTLQGTAETPEPSSAFLLLGGMGVAGVLMRRKRNAAS